MLRERRCEEIPPEPQEAGAILGALVALRVIGASGNIMVEEAGLEPMTLEESEELRGLSQGLVFCLRREAGLICEVADAV
jgi:hypothetical protein